MAAYSRLDAPSSSSPVETAQTFLPSPSPTRNVLRWIWPFQVLITIPKIILLCFLMIFLFLFTFLINLGSQSRPGVLGVVLAFGEMVLEIYLACSIFVTVWHQYRNKPQADAYKALKQEAKKTGFATYLWLWTLFTNPERYFSMYKNNSKTGDMDEESARIAKSTRAIVIAWNIYIVFVVLLFYLPLYIAYRGWKSERDNPKTVDIELEHTNEDGIGLVDRTSVETLGSLFNNDDFQPRK